MLTQLPLEDEGIEFVRALCTAAGDDNAVLELMRQVHAAIGREKFLDLAPVALLLTFARCLPGPVNLDLQPNTHQKENPQ